MREFGDEEVTGGVEEIGGQNYWEKEESSTPKE